MNLFTSYTYYIGLNDKVSQTQLYETSHYIEVLRNLLDSDEVENYTYEIVQGIYKGIKENTIKLELIDDGQGLSQEVLESIKYLFNQECILVTERVLTNSKLV